MYYRVAIQVEASPPWQWKSTALNSLNLLLQWLQVYRAFPRERLRIFSSPSREELNEQLARENRGFLSTSVPATRFLQELLIAPREGGQAAGGSRANERTYLVAAVAGLSPAESSTSELSKQRERLERGSGGDHNTPYQFALPISLPQLLAWLTLQVRVQQGDLQGEVIPSGRSDRNANFCSKARAYLKQGVLTPQNLLTRKKGDFMSRSEIRAIVCAGKIGIDSSIQAQRAGEVMSQNWRMYCLFDIWNQTGTI